MRVTFGVTYTGMAIIAALLACEASSVKVRHHHEHLMPSQELLEATEMLP